MRYSVLFILCFWLMSIKAQSFQVTVSNPTGDQRHEVIQLNYKDVLEKLGKTPSSIVVTNEIHQESEYQITYDGKLLIEAHVRPHGQTIYTISKGTPKIPHMWVQGRYYPQREDDIAWENDRCAYRVYGPALQRSGEKAFGIDVWVKKTPELVVEDRYTWHFVGKKNFHLDYGYGYDPYLVGASLGCGTPALIEGDSIAYPYCYKDYQILDNGPLRFTLSLTYPQQADGRTEHRIISLDKGMNFNRIEVWYDGQKSVHDVAAGVVIHQDDTDEWQLQKNYVIYADPTDKMHEYSDQVYVGAIFPYNDVKTRFVAYQQEDKQIAGHILGIHHNLKPSEHFIYYAGAAWSQYDVKTMKEWKLRTEEALYSIQHPLKCYF